MPDEIASSNKSATPQPPPKSASPPIMDNQSVKELLVIMRDSNTPTMRDFVTVLQQVTAMERQLNTAVNELAAMRKQLAEAQAVNHPAANEMQKSVAVKQSFISDFRDKLAEIKSNIIGGCKNAVAAFKEKGIAALNNVMGFFKIKPMLETVRNDLNKSIAYDNKAINKIETISKNYHEAGKHLRNVGRAILGKEAIQEAKPVGKIAKTFIAPYKTERSCCESLKKQVEAALGGLAKLEQRAVEKRPSMMANIADLDKKVAQDKKDTPVVDTPKVAKDAR